MGDLMTFLEQNFSKEDGIDEIETERTNNEGSQATCPELEDFRKELMCMKCKFEAIVEYTGAISKGFPGNSSYY